ncbi:MAG TPA: hypothetical protein RMH99_17180 [Sandaracinaceae bacterium LLY-WYZ-13_1]|nr:hypothetical protein [Sandaracinaceae bacterium LLY-WYZ-13_1]
MSSLTLVRAGGAVYALPGDRVRAVRARRVREAPPSLVPGAPTPASARVLELDTADGPRVFAVEPTVELAAIDDEGLLPLPPLVTRATPRFAALAAFLDRPAVLVIDPDQLHEEDGP